LSSSCGCCIATYTCGINFCCSGYTCGVPQCAYLNAGLGGGGAGATVTWNTYCSTYNICGTPCLCFFGGAPGAGFVVVEY